VEPILTTVSLQSDSDNLAEKNISKSRTLGAAAGEATDTSSSSELVMEKENAESKWQHHIPWHDLYINIYAQLPLGIK
jgi:hypothetical protein